MFIDGPPGKGVARIKIIDFGLATKFDPKERMRDVCGTPNYLAPEMIAGDYNCKVDVFSVGVILYTMLSLRLPF